MAVLKSSAMGVNVSVPERLASMIGGGSLIAFGLAKRGWGGAAMATLGGALLYRGAQGHCDLYQALGINTAKKDGNTSVPYELGVRVDRSVIINRAPEELYGFWRNFENLPKFMQHLECVVMKDNKRSHWVAKAPLGFSVEWDAEIINEIPNELIGWRSLEGSDVDNAGSVHFRPVNDGRSTEVTVHLQYNPPAGYLGAAVAKMFGEEPSKQITGDLQRFKGIMESGGPGLTQGQSSDKQASTNAQKASASKKMWNRDEVTSQSEESFPASDPPSWTPEALSK